MESNLFREIPGFPNYLACSDGTVWTLRRKGGSDRGPGRLGKPRQLKTHFSGAGYMTLSLVVDGKAKAMRVHRLILLAFIGPCPDGFHGCHYPDPDKTNNRPENLRWDTASENAKDRHRDRPFVAQKRCKRCGKTKSRESFYADTRASDGLKTECKRCHIKTSIGSRDAGKKQSANADYMRRQRQLDPSRWR